MMSPEAQGGRDHPLGVVNDPQAGALTVDPDRRDLDDAIVQGPGDQEQIHVEEEVAGGEQGKYRVDDVAPEHLGAALRVPVWQVEQLTHPEGEGGTGEPPAQRPGCWQDRGRMPTGSDGAVSLCRGLRQAEQLGRGGRAVGIDEPDQLGSGTAERLHDDAALAEAAIFMKLDPRVFGGMATDDLGCAVTAIVEGDHEPDVVTGAD